ncbi:E3 ubiquitin-protein ligase RSL1-like [Impatiens glandulifera]|uniref:E3 ubiquitin-protein ligase RSL1-like n=1 Tax=Impatiens glandulifera TaxID=253017 RepID=UPI001FB0575C|nr:E3 ubiquitin-protein ligase RSL1-like [Impatiens glandulifera]
MGNKLQRCIGKDVSNSSATVSSPEPPSQLESFTCNICHEPTLPYERKFKNKHICDHTFCKDCINKYVQVKVNEHNVAKIKCPSLCCDFNLDPLSCSLILPAKIFEKWCDFLCQDAILGVDHCYCPNKECSALIMNECGGKVKRSVCPNCKQLLCFNCKISWHDGFSCEESGVIRDAEDVAFKVLEKVNNWKRCPKCRHCVELWEDVEFSFATIAERRRIVIGADAP